MSRAKRRAPSLQDASRRLREAHGSVAAFLDQAEDDSVYWVERGGRDETQYSLHAAPVNVADRLRPLLFGAGKSIVLTSATLGVGDPEARLLPRPRRRGKSAGAVHRQSLRLSETDAHPDLQIRAGSRHAEV